VILIVAGTAGSGKTTVGALIAGRLRWRFADADPFHPEANVAKMRQGIPLTDEDRQPWLRAVGDWIDERIAANDQAVVTCSALRRAYREMLDRPDHFFPRRLLESQLADLELPKPDEERVHPVLSQGDPAETAAKVIATMWPYGEPNSGRSPVPGVL
jgi:gluconokinase